MDTRISRFMTLSHGTNDPTLGRNKFEYFKWYEMTATNEP